MRKRREEKPFMAVGVTARASESHGLGYYRIEVVIPQGTDLDGTDINALLTRFGGTVYRTACGGASYCLPEHADRPAISTGNKQSYLQFAAGAIAEIIGKPLPTGTSLAFRAPCRVKVEPIWAIRNRDGQLIPARFAAEA